MEKQRFKDSGKNAIVREFANSLLKQGSVYSSLSDWDIDGD